MAKGSDIIKIGFDYRASLEQFEKETNGVFDGISAKAGKQRISIQLDAKNDKVIEKIKELQKLKLDKFTFEFGESGLAEQLKTFNQLEKKIGEIIKLGEGKSLIDSSSTVSDIGKIANATNQQVDAVKKATSAYKNQAYELASILKMLGKIDDASESYAGKLSETIKKRASTFKNGETMQFSTKESGFAEETLKYLRGFSINLQEGFNFSETLGLDVATIKNFEVLIQHFRELLKEKLEFNNVKLNTSDIEELIKALGILKKEHFDDGTKTGRNIYGDGSLDKYSNISEITSYLKQQEQQILATAEAEQKLVNVEQQSSDSSLTENQDKIQQELKETEQIAEQTAEALEKVNSNGNKSNISSENPNVPEAESYQKITNDTVSVLTDIGKTEDQIIAKIQKERLEAEANNDVLREHLVLLDKAGNVVANHWGSKSNVNGTFSSEQLSKAEGGKIIHAHPGKASFFGGKDLQHLLQDSMYEQIKQIDLIWGDSTLSVDKSTLTKESSDTILNIMRNVRKTLTEVYGDNPDGNPSQEAREHINAIEKEIFKSLAKQLNVSVSEDGNMAQEVTNSLSDIDKAIIQKFKGIETSVMQNADASFVNSTIKDVFQNEKVEHATTSAKELDKTLEQVNIPTDSFDDVLSKLDLAKSELKDIVKITKQSISDSEGKFHDSYTLKDSRGSTEIYGLSSNTEKGQLLRSNIVQYDSKSSKEYKQQELEVEKQITEEIKKQDIEQKKKWNSFQKEKTEENKKAYQELTDTIQQYSEVSKRISSGKTLEGDIELAQKLEDKISNLQKQDILSSTQIDASERKLEKLFNQLDAIEKKQDDISKQKTIFSFNENDLTSLQAKVDKLTNPQEGSHYFEYYTNQVAELSSKLNRLQEIAKIPIDTVTQDEIKEAEELKKNIDGLYSSLSSVKQSQRGWTDVSATNLAEKFNQALEDNPRLSRVARDEIQALYHELINGNPSRPLGEMKNRLNEIIQSEREAGRAGKNWLDIFKDKKIYGFLGQMASMFSFYDLINVGKQGIQTVRELDTALTEMRKVSDESVQSLKNYQATTFDVADAVGTTAVQIQNSTADFMRLGESIDSAAESSRVANILLNVSEFDSISDATDSLVAMGQAYKDLDKIEIVDKLNEVGNNYAISTDELASALQKSAATLSLMGNSIDEAAALITTANSVLMDADSVSAGMRTISLRIVGTEQAEEELSALNEEVDEFVKATNSKKQQIIKDYTAVASNNYKGFDILDENGNYKNTYDILLGISKIYKEIQEEDKKLGTNRAVALVEELAGKNRSNVASAILSDPKQLEAVKKSSEEAFGSAEEELNKYLDSVDGKLAQLSNRAQEFWATTINSELIKDGIDLLTALVGGATDLIDTIGTLPALLTTIGGALAFKNIGRPKMFGLVLKYADNHKCSLGY